MTARALAAGCLLVACIAAASGAAPARIEARSTDLVVVGVVQGDTMTIHVSRALDNAPVSDAAVTVALRGNHFPTVARLDGGYTLHAGELALRGATAVEFHIVSGDTDQRVAGTLQVAGPSDKPDDRGSGSARQIAWWILNFAVCGGFLLLLSRRRKKTES